METGDHLTFAKKINGEVWELLGKKDRSPAEDERMVHAAHASLYHWLYAGTGINHQRGEWLIARVHILLGDPVLAERHTRRCLELTDEHAAEMQDFDFAFAHELAARTAALTGDRARAAMFIEKARQAGAAIADPEDRKVFFDDFFGNPWFGVDPGTRLSV
ncbi:MAG TPA: hypothetical protein VLD63_07310 [Anaerolineales bacterium]|nr:hypothetical protein [Anaerolineales bacterium]